MSQDGSSRARVSQDWAKAYFADLLLDRASGVPMHSQISAFLRNDIATGRLAPGAPLQSARALARQLGCSRNTVVLAFDELQADGLLEIRARGTARVAPALAAELHTDARSPESVEGFRRSILADRLLAIEDYAHEAFDSLSPALPDTRTFPFQLWTGLFRKVWASPSAELVTSRDPRGYAPLRAAIATYLAALRGYRIAPDQIIIFPGTRHALQTVARLLIEPGDQAWCEDPTFLSCRMALTGAGAQIVPVPVDADGLDVAAGRALAPDARLVVLSPSNQFPLGGVMSMQRRRDLLDWANAAQAWIFEDDYDSEFQFASQPLPPIAALPGADRTIYFGTFSKVIAPNLRLSYCVAHPDVAAEIARFRLRIDAFTALPLQPVLARFIADGHLSAHVAELSRDHDSKLALLQRHCAGPLGQLFDLNAPRAGLHAVLHFKPALSARTSDVELARSLLATGLQVKPLSQYYLSANPRHGLVFGYQHLGVTALERAFATIQTAALARIAEPSAD